MEKGLEVRPPPAPDFEDEDDLLLVGLRLGPNT